MSSLSALRRVLGTTRRVLLPMPYLGLRSSKRGAKAILSLGRAVFSAGGQRRPRPVSMVGDAHLEAIRRQSRIMFAIYLVGAFYTLGWLAFSSSLASVNDVLQALLAALVTCLLLALAFRAAVSNWQARTRGAEPFSTFLASPKTWLPD
jgi:hypothetical protein